MAKVKGTRGYSSYRGRGSGGRKLLAVLLVLIVAASVAFMAAQRHVVYEADGSFHFELPWGKRPTEQTTDASPSGECERGIVICTTGIGISIAANKVRGIRCAHCADALEATLCRQHNNANMIAIGAGFTGPKLASAMVEAFLSPEFEGGRHARRVALMDAIEG